MWLGEVMGPLPFLLHFRADYIATSWPKKRSILRPQLLVQKQANNSTREMRINPQLRKKLSVYTGGLIKQVGLKPGGMGAIFTTTWESPSENRVDPKKQELKCGEAQISGWDFFKYSDSEHS